MLESPLVDALRNVFLFKYGWRVVALTVHIDWGVIWLHEGLACFGCQVKCDVKKINSGFICINCDFKIISIKNCTYFLLDELSLMWCFFYFFLIFYLCRTLIMALTAVHKSTRVHNQV